MNSTSDLFAKKVCNALSQPGRIGNLAFPNNKDPPSKLLQLPHHSCVTLDIRLEFFPPERHPRFRRGRERAGFVPMPKAAMNENHRAVSRKNDVRRSRQLPWPKPEPESHLVEDAPD